MAVFCDQRSSCNRDQHRPKRPRSVSGWRVSCTHSNALKCAENIVILERDSNNRLFRLPIAFQETISANVFINAETKAVAIRKTSISTAERKPISVRTQSAQRCPVVSAPTFLTSNTTGTNPTTTRPIAGRAALPLAFRGEFEDPHRQRVPSERTQQQCRRHLFHHVDQHQQAGSQSPGRSIGR